MEEEDSIDDMLHGVLLELDETIHRKLIEQKPYNYDLRDYLAIVAELEHRGYDNVDRLRANVAHLQPKPVAPAKKLRRIA